MRGRQTVRHLRLIGALEGRPGGVSPAELAAELGVTVRTLYRDLAVLHEVGYPLVTERDGREVRWRLMEPRRPAVGRLAEDELVALAAGAVLVGAYLPDRFGDAYRAALARLQLGLDGEASRRLRGMLEAIVAASGAQAGSGDPVMPALLSAVREGGGLDRGELERLVAAREGRAELRHPRRHVPRRRARA